MSYLVKDFLGKRGKKGDVGLELEVEAAAQLPVIKDDYWITKEENSLRAAFKAEYVSNGPQTITSGCKGIRALCWELNQKKYRVDSESPRTSFHVHSNILYSTPKQFWNSAVAYWLCEDLLYEYLDPLRKGNCFCLRLTDAEGVLPYCYEDLRGALPFRRLATDNIRYGGQNLAAAIKFGTIERRGMDGRIDPSRMETWVSALNQLEQVSKSYAHPSALLDDYHRTEAKDFLRKIFGPYFTETITKRHDWRDVMLNSAATISDLAYYHSWDRWEEKINKRLGNTKQEEIIYDEVPDVPPARDATQTIGNARIRAMRDVLMGHEMRGGVAAQEQPRPQAATAPGQPVPRQQF